MGKWQRVEVEDPIFRKGTKKYATVLVGNEPMYIRRYISPTSAWVERMKPLDRWMATFEDRRTPFVEYLKGTA